jgi:hypothetical protein
LSLLERPYRLRFLSLVAACVFVGTAAHGAQVLAVGKNKRSVAVDHDPGHQWVAGDRVCVVQAKVSVVCGNVRKTTAKGAIVALDTTYENISVGDTVAYAPGFRKPAAELLDSAEKIAPRERKIFSATAGMNVGPSFFFPLVHLQISPVRNFSIGFQPLYFRGSSVDGSVSAFGGYGTLNYYFRSDYSGLWLQGGAGAFSMNAQSTLFGDQSKTVLAGIFTLGYRGGWERSGLNLGIAAGIQYLQDPNFNSIIIRAQGVNPVLMVDVGFVF